MGSFEPTPQIPQKHGIFGTFRRNRAEPGCRCRTDGVAAEGFIFARNIYKRKKCDYDFTHKKRGYFHSHTCVFGQLYCDFYAGLKDKCQLPVGVYNDPVERFEHERIAELVDFSDLVNQKTHLFRTVSDEDVLGIIDR